MQRHYARFSPAPQANAGRHHKFGVGQKVTLLPVAGTRTPKALERTLAASTFEIMRLLPEQGADFLYRVKNAATGQERVATESEIRLA